MIDQATARALCEAGYIPVSTYLRMISENGWAPPAQPPIQRLSAASRRGARVRKLLKSFRQAFLRHKSMAAPKMVKMYRQGRRPKDLLADMRRSND